MTARALGVAASSPLVVDLTLRRSSALFLALAAEIGATAGELLEPVAPAQGLRGGRLEPTYESARRP